MLQHSDEYTITSSMCKLIRTRKVAVCGAADHDPSLYDKSFTYRRAIVDVVKCRMTHRDPFTWKHKTKTNIGLH